MEEEEGAKRGQQRDIGEGRSEVRKGQRGTAIEGLSQRGEVKAGGQRGKGAGEGTPLEEVLGKKEGGRKKKGEGGEEEEEGRKEEEEGEVEGKEGKKKEEKEEEEKGERGEKEERG
ncbi:hypothetical protein JMK10_19965, partial [Rhodovulum sulfidophilum]|uniref:hypothetical protein n=1 Tax=Rhodovulum sulfidophilum TaxID=35806 RepID=UPI0019234FE3